MLNRHSTRLRWLRAAAALALLAAVAITASAEPRDRSVAAGRYQVIHDFEGTKRTGLGSPDDNPLVRATDGYLYGTSSSWNGSVNKGSIYRVSPSGQVRVVKQLEQPTGADPQGLTASRTGGVYGIARKGGRHGCGVIFRLDADGSYTVLWNFDKDDAVIGGFPSTRLAEGADGSLYGSTDKGSTSNWGAIFRFMPGGDMSLIRAYNDRRISVNEPSAQADLLMASDGHLYQAGDYEKIFRITLGGLLAPVADISPGFSPAEGELLEGQDGNLYGTAVYGGPKSSGILFRIDKATQGVTVLHTFGGSQPDGRDGENPVGVTQGRDGYLYGSTGKGGLHDGGTLWRIATDGSGYSIVLRFTGRPGTGTAANGDGANPSAAPTETPDGRWVGTTIGGGTKDLGTVYALTPR